VNNFNLTVCLELF